MCKCLFLLLLQTFKIYQKFPRTLISHSCSPSTHEVIDIKITISIPVRNTVKELTTIRLCCTSNTKQFYQLLTSYESSYKYNNMGIRKKMLRQAQTCEFDPSHTLKFPLTYNIVSFLNVQSIISRLCYTVSDSYYTWHGSMVYLMEPITEVTEVKEDYSHQFKMSHLLYTCKIFPSASSELKN